MKLVMETGSIADAVNKASRVAPTKGPAFHPTAGVVFDVDENGAEPLVLRATDLEVTYRQRVRPNSVSGSGAWRVPAQLLAGILNGLPLGSGSTVTFEDKPDKTLHITSGRKRAKLHLIDDLNGYPKIEAFDPTGMAAVPGFAQRVAQVAWSCHAKDAPLTGVHIDGTRLVATDKYCMTVVPLVVPVAEPITVPLSLVSGLLKNTSEVAVRATENRFQMMTDEDTQASTVIFTAAYPKIEAINRVLRDDFTERTTVDRESFQQAITRMLVLVKGEEAPWLRLEFSEDSIGIRMDMPEVGVMDDTIDADGGPTGDPLELWLTPAMVTGALGAASMSTVTLDYGPDPAQSISVRDGTGYRSDIMPKIKSVPGQ